MSRHAEIAMSPAEPWDFLDEERTLTCASIGPGGRPHLMPLWYVREGDVVMLECDVEIIRDRERVLDIVSWDHRKLGGGC